MLTLSNIRYLMTMAVIFSAIILSACQSSGGGSEPQDKDATPYNTACCVDFETYAQGVESGFLIDRYTLAAPTLFIIRTQDELEQFWMKHAAIFFPQPAIPQIDFSSDMLIAVVDTIEPTGGYSLCIEALHSSAGTVSVLVRKTCPAPGDIVTDALTVPYHIITSARSDDEYVLEIAR